MFSSQAITPLLAILASINCITASSSVSGFQISQLKTYQSSPNATYSNTSISFLVHDPVSVANVTALCTGSWASNTSYPTGGYLPCTGETNTSAISWNFEDGSFENIHQFTLQIEHSYEDDAVGEAPYNYIINFAKLSITGNQTACSAGGEICELLSNSTLLAPIWASIAR